MTHHETKAARPGDGTSQTGQRIETVKPQSQPQPSAPAPVGATACDDAPVGLLHRALCGSSWQLTADCGLEVLERQGWRRDMRRGGWCCPNCACGAVEVSHG